MLAILAASSSLPSTTEDDDDNKNVGLENVPGGSHVRILDETNFQETIGENCCVMVFFHAECEYRIHVESFKDQCATLLYNNL